MGKKGMTPKRASIVWQGKTKLHKLRVKKGLSQNELAVVSGVSKPSILQYEQKVRPIDGARLSTLCDLCLSLDCKIEDLLESKELIEKYRKVK